MPPDKKEEFTLLLSLIKKSRICNLSIELAKKVHIFSLVISQALLTPFPVLHLLLQTLQTNTKDTYQQQPPSVYVFDRSIELRIPQKIYE
jgi:hypothetical protein